MTSWINYSVKQWAEAVHANNVRKGWYEGIDLEKIREFGAPKVDWMIMRLALVGTEVSEAIEAVRTGEAYLWYREDGKPEGLASELADIVIRVMDIAESLGIDLEQAIAIKHAYNTKRPHRHGGKLA